MGNLGFQFGITVHGNAPIAALKCGSGYDNRISLGAPVLYVEGLPKRSDVCSKNGLPDASAICRRATKTF